MIKEEHLGIVEEEPNIDPKEAMQRATEIVDCYFKRSLVIEEPTEELKELLLDNGFQYDNKFSIHWQTLRSYCKKQRDRGRNIPEGISVFEYTEAELK